MKVRAAGNTTESSSIDSHVDISGIALRFVERTCDFYRYYPEQTTSSALGEAIDEESEEFWGTPAAWEALQKKTPSSEKLKEFAAYLRSTGQASI